LKTQCGKALKTQEMKSLTLIAISDSNIANCDMRLGEKIRYLREVEGTLRGYGRAFTQQEIVRAVKKEMGKSISQSYLSQIESGARPHLTNSTRMLLARFFKVHPGYLVDDPEGFHNELISDLGVLEDKLDLWLINGAERFRRDVEVSQALLEAAKHEDSRRCLVLLGAILETPNLVDRLLQVLKPENHRHGNHAAELALKGNGQRRREL
jgi:transcriptional regulator with XRE-family HTH domain